MYIYIYMYIYVHIHDSQIVHHNPCFNLFILHHNSFDNQESEISQNDIFYFSTYCIYILYLYKETDIDTVMGYSRKIRRG